MAMIRKLQRMKCLPKITIDILIKNQTHEHSHLALAGNGYSIMCAVDVINRFDRSMHHLKSITSFMVLVNFGAPIMRDKVINMTGIIAVNWHSDRFIHESMAVMAN